jgi:hypothetical protein
MKTKTLNKLNNVLKGLELSKEQKQILVEVFDEISSNSGGGQSNTVYVNMISEYEKPPILKIGDFEISISDANYETDEEGYTTLKLYNKRLYKYLKEAYDAKWNVVVTDYTEVLEYALVRPRSTTYTTTFGYIGDTTDYFYIKILLDLRPGFSLEMKIYDYDK